MDWGEGSYELTAAVLTPAAVVAVEALGELKGRRVLDVGCGTGNAALLAALHGARVTGVDPAVRLLEVARKRAAGAKLEVEFVPGSGASLPFPDASIDDALSVFALIFAPDARAVAKELRRVVKRGGRLAMTAWAPRGPIYEVGMLVRKALLAAAPQPPAGTLMPQWHDGTFVGELFGGSVTTREQVLHFTAASAEAWFAEQEQSHPIYRQASAMLGGTGAWKEVRTQAVALLEAANTSPTRFDAASAYPLHVVHFS